MTTAERIVWLRSLGYGSPEIAWTSFLLKRIHEKSLNDWNVNKRINDAIKKKVDELWSACAKKARQDALAAFQDELERAVPESVG